MPEKKEFESASPIYRKQIYFRKEDLPLLEDLKEIAKKSKAFEDAWKVKEDSSGKKEVESVSLSRVMVILIKRIVESSKKNA